MACIDNGHNFIKGECVTCGVPVEGLERLFINWMDNIPKRDPRHKQAVTVAKDHLERCYNTITIQFKVKD